MKVLFVTRKWAPAVGGMETYSMELCKELDSRVELSVRKLPGKPDGDPPGAFSLLRFFVSNLFYLMVNAKRFDVVHLGDFVLAPLGLISKWSSKRTKVVIMIHGLDILFGNRRGLLPAIYRLYQYAMSKLQCADCFIVNSENTGKLSKEAGFVPVKEIPLGVNTQLPAVNNTHHDNTILFLGRLVVRKGASWFATQILPKLPDKHRLIVVGKTWDQSEQHLLEKCERVELVGYASEQHLNKLKSSCMVAVMPNQPSENNQDVEGFGLVAAELSIQGVPLIASNIEGITSAVLDQKTGFLIPHHDQQSWINTIAMVANWDQQQRQNFCQQCVAQTRQYFNWQRVADETLSTYHSLLSQ